MILGGKGNDRLFGADHTVDHIKGGLGTTTPATTSGTS
jgi:hypothetical protein